MQLMDMFKILEVDSFDTEASWFLQSGKDCPVHAGQSLIYENFEAFT